MIKNNIINPNEKLREEEKGDREKKVSNTGVFSFTHKGGVV